MTIGAWLLKQQQKYGHGLQVAYFRDTVRQKILDTLPIANTTDLSCEIHVLTYERDWLNLIWTLKSFYFYSKRHYALCIHDDGTLTSEHRAILHHHFPNARIIERPIADQKVLAELIEYPRCLEFRSNNHLSPKIFDFVSYLKGDRLLLLDSDILFFAEPTELLQRIEDPDYHFNTVNGDVANSYTVDPKMVEKELGFSVIQRFNSGLGLIHKDSLNLDWIEEFLGLPDILGHFWLIEQTLYALCSSRYGGELLPPSYDVHLEGGINEAPSRHYVGKIRHLMYGEGMKKLVKKGFLKELKA